MKKNTASAAPAPAALPDLPPPSPVEQAFNDLQRLLEQHNVGQWTAEEAGQLAAFVTEFARVSRRKRPRDACSDALCNQQHNADAEDQPGNAAEDADDARFDQSMELFKFLTRVRTHLRKEAPFGRPADATTIAPQHDASFPASTPTFEIDAFLFDEDDLDSFVAGGMVSREYCEACRGTRIGLTQFISHSFSQEQLVFIFSYALPAVIPAAQRPVPQLLDVGSRYGIVLAAAAKAGIARAVVGVEISPHFVAQQEQLFARLRIDAAVRQLDVTSEAGLALLTASDVVVLNNVFQWFAKEADQLVIWKKLRKALSRPGQVLVVNPKLEDSLGPLAAAFDAAFDTDAFVGSWLDAVDVSSAVGSFAAERRSGSKKHASPPEGSDGDDATSSAAGDEDEEVELARSIHFYRVK